MAPEGRETPRTGTACAGARSAASPRAGARGAPPPALGDAGGGLESRRPGRGPPLSSTGVHFPHDVPTEATPPPGRRSRAAPRPRDIALVPATRPRPPSAGACWGRARPAPNAARAPRPPCRCRELEQLPSAAGRVGATTRGPSYVHTGAHSKPRAGLRDATRKTVSGKHVTEAAGRRPRSVQTALPAGSRAWGWAGPSEEPGTALGCHVCGALGPGVSAPSRGLAGAPAGGGASHARRPRCAARLACAPAPRDRDPRSTAAAPKDVLGGHERGAGAPGCEWVGPGPHKAPARVEGEREPRARRTRHAPRPALLGGAPSGPEGGQGARLEQGRHDAALSPIQTAPAGRERPLL